MKRVLSVLLTLVVAVVLYGAVIEPRLLLDGVAFEAEVPGLPPAWEGERVALLADFQIGMWGGNEGMARHAVQDAIESEVAAVLFAGDFVYSPDSATVDRAVGIVRPVREAGIPLVAVFGNHDHSLMDRSSERGADIAGYLRQRLESIGATVLENEAVELRREGGSLWVAGIGSVWVGASDPAAALDAVPDGAPRLVLMHNPESYREVPAGEGPLALAGHTHGGQIRLPFMGRAQSWLDIVREGETVADGWALDSLGAPANRLYVSRGIGFSGAPIRVNCRPELTIITLHAADGDMPTRGPVTPGA